MSPAASSTIYKGKSGQWSFVAHRVTGFLVFMFLLLHIVDVSLVNIDPELYDTVHELYGNILLRLFECGLLFALLYHSMNGLRIVLVDFFPGVIRKEKMLTGLVVFVTLAAGIPGSIVILWPFIDGRIL
ncbi:MAG TPA: succinate dehydrogenase, cytochrome b556 subunit [Acidimicrobiales bacterium]|nr:succinate dehydrogenase, cytochrome b556 subunit [Acidimicrobiales bacterium]